MRRTTSLLFLILALFAGTLFADNADVRREIEAVMTRQVAAWNAGDLEGFCADYTEDTVFISPSGIRRGRSEVLARYRESYPDRAAQGQLTIEVLDFRAHDGGGAAPSAVHAATVVGRWTLAYPGDAERETATGLTMIIFERDGDSWKIVRDASM